MRLLSPFKRVAEEALVGKSIRLVVPRADHFEQWSSLRLESRHFLEQWEPSWDDNELTRSSFRLRLKRYDELREQDLAEAYFVFADDTLTGAITLSNIRRGVAQMGTLGYWIGAAHARKGYMTEAITLMTEHASGPMHLHRIEAACLPRNAASIGLLEKCKFSREGYAKQYLKIAGRWEDHCLYGRTLNGY